jgi:hypothetical protein
MNENEVRIKATVLAKRADLITLQVMASSLSKEVSPNELQVVRHAIAILENEPALQTYWTLMGEPE